MRDTFRDMMMVVAAIAALFAGLQSWITDNKLDEVREELAEARGELRVTTNAVIAHVNEPGLHGRSYSNDTPD